LKLDADGAVIRTYPDFRGDSAAASLKPMVFRQARHGRNSISAAIPPRPH